MRSRVPAVEILNDFAKKMFLASDQFGIKRRPALESIVSQDLLTKSMDGKDCRFIKCTDRIEEVALGLIVIRYLRVKPGKKGVNRGSPVQDLQSSLESSPGSASSALLSPLR